MLLVRTNELLEGDKLARALYAPDGRLMLHEGAVMTARLIDSIRKHGHQYVYVEMNERRRAAGGSDWNHRIRQLTGSLMTDIVRALARREPLPAKPLLDWADEVSAAVGQRRGGKLSRRDVPQEADELISHSLNVCLIAVLTAEALGYPAQRLREVAIGSLLHDVGLIVPMDRAMLAQHPRIGYDMLRGNGFIPEASLQIVLQHHEQLNGRGYPRGIGGEDIAEAALICAVASDFDDLLNRSPSTRHPSDAVDSIMSRADTAYGAGVVRAFLSVFEPYPIGTAVRLTGGLRGIVCEHDRHNPCRPVVLIQPSGARLKLAEHQTFRIERVEADSPREQAGIP